MFTYELVKMRPSFRVVTALLSVLAALVWQTEAQLAVMSIDLGSEYMKVAIVKAGVPMEIALNKESRRKTAVIVAMRDDDRTFSDAALNIGVRYPKNAYWHLQDLMGKRFNNPLVQQFRKKFPYYDMEEDPETGTAVFKHSETIKYSPEELIAMILERAKITAEDYAGQKMNEAVITVPAFFNQAERRSLLRSAELSGIRVLQLINDNTAVALNYGVFRRKEFNTTASHYMFFDIGASATTATIVAYQVVKAKNAETGLLDTFPQLTIKGVGFDRTLGGLNMNLRLRDHLADVFTSQKKTSTDVRTSARAMAKLLKEADRVKRVLSANMEHSAQIEGLLDDQDFRCKVTRDQLDSLSSDMEVRIQAVVKAVLKASEVTMDEIKEVILMGGGTRMPNVQDYLRKAVGREELGKGINTDEAAAMGAAYQAAHLSKGFKVKKFGIKDANLFPIQVEFERIKSDSGETKMVKRTLFGRNNPYPQKKVMTFNKHTSDFTFTVNYADMSSFMDEADIKAFDATTLHEVSLTGIAEAQSKHGQDAESKGVKAHFRMDDSGVLTLDKVESVFEKTVAAEEEVDDSNIQSTLSKLGSKLSSLFGSVVEEKSADTTASPSTDTPESADADQKPADQPPLEQPADGSTPPPPTPAGEPTADPVQQDEPTTTTPPPADEEAVKQGDEKKDEEKTVEDGKSEAGNKTSSDDLKKDEAPEKKAPKKKKQVVMKEEISSSVVIVDIKEPSADVMKTAKKRIRKLMKRDEEQAMRERVQNELESFIVDAQDKLYQETYETSSTEAERDTIRTQLSAASDWLYEQDTDTAVTAFEQKLSELRALTSDLYMRVREADERPRALEALKGMLNYTRHFLVSLKNFTGEDQPFTMVEFDVLSKLINDTKQWKVSMEKDQAKLSAHEKPKMTVEEIAKKINDLDREVKYLLNKAKTFRPKVKPTIDEKNKTTADNTTKTDGESKEEKKEDKSKEAVVEDDDEATVEVEDSSAEPTETPTTDSPPTEPELKKATDEL